MPDALTLSPPRSVPRLVSIGRICFAAGIAFFGAQHLIHGDFVTRAMPPWPAWIPARAFGAWLIGAAFLTAGGAILLRRHARRSANLLGLTIVFFALVIAVPLAFSDVWLGGRWTDAGKAFVLAGGAGVTASTFPIERGSPIDRFFVLLGRLLLGGFMILAGIQHVVWFDFVKVLVPAWVPGGAAFWTYFSAVALIAGGLGLFLPRTARLAALLSGVMIFAWVLMLHIPRALADLHDTNEATAVFEALAFSGIAFMLTQADPKTQLDR